MASLSGEELEAQITELAGQMNAATYRWLVLIAEFDRRNEWADGCLKSCAHWLNFKVGLNLGAAREKVRVAHALDGMPKIAAAMARGNLSYSKVRALTRVATPATEDTLLMIALHGTAHHVESVARYFRQAQEAAALSDEAQQQAGRTVEYWYDGDGSLVLKARLPALAGAVLVKALDAAIEAVPATEVIVALAEEQPLLYAARRADALALMADSYLQQGPPAGSTADRHQVVVHVDVEALREQAPGRCHIEDGPSLPVTTARRLTCDASLLRITENADGPLDVGRKTRTIPPAIRRALNSRDPGCCFPGCTHRRYVDAHHIDHWADGGHTQLANLVSLCRMHHRLVHEGGITVAARVGGGWRFSRPDGREFAAARCEPVPLYSWRSLGDANLAHHIVIDPSTAATRWQGERMNYDLAVSLLCAEAHVPDPIYPAYRANPAPTTNDRSADDCSADDCSADDCSADDFPANDVSANDFSANNVSAETSRDTADTADAANAADTADTADIEGIEGIERSDDKSYWWDGRSWREYDPD